MRHRKLFFIICLLTAIVVFSIKCITNNSSSGNDARGSRYADNKTCGSCHKAIMASYLHTNHYKTSAKVNRHELEKFIDSSNNVVYYEDSVMVKLEEKEPGFFQSYIKGGRMLRSEKLDLAVGSGEKAQTYAYWKNDQLFELPLTYFAGRQRWTNSPGYPIRKPYFDRPILSRCLECHSSFVSKTDIQTGPLQVSEKLNPGSIIFGIDCQRCHGPAAEHVQFHQENPSARQARFITAVKSLSRQQKLDMCASCHSGNDLDVQRSLFAFLPGDTLANFYFPHFGSGTAEPDVHARQMQLLQSSKCFQQSTMTCATCHNAHEEENKRDIFIAKCMDCHQNSQHAKATKATSTGCIDCHMPLQVSKSLDFNDGTEMKSIPYLLRTHRIGIYPEIK